METGRLHMIIQGQVQGVFFRAATRDAARALGLTGWVRNLNDGSVEAVFEGSMDRLKQVVTWCHKGPPGASVTSADEKWYDFTGEYDNFDVLFRY